MSVDFRNSVPSWSSFGVVLGVQFGILFRPRARTADFLEIVLPPAWEHHFRGPRGSQNKQNRRPGTMSSGNLAPRGSWEPPRLDFGLFGGPKLVPRTVEKATWNFIPFLSPKRLKNKPGYHGTRSALAKRASSSRSRAKSRDSRKALQNS